mgnify:FL=1
MLNDTSGSQASWGFVVSNVQDGCIFSPNISAIAGFDEPDANANSYSIVFVTDAVNRAGYETTSFDSDGYTMNRDALAGSATGTMVVRWECDK